MVVLSRWSKAVATGAAAVGTLTLGAGPASAYPNWQPWVQPASYKCGTTATHQASNNIAMQTCIVRNTSNNTYQAVAIVVNNAPTTVYLEAIVQTLSHSRFDTCNKTPVAPGKRVACYAETVPGDVHANSRIILNNGLNDFTTTVFW